jgi:hypothetical protein
MNYRQAGRSRRAIVEKPMRTAAARVLNRMKGRRKQFVGRKEPL